MNKNGAMLEVRMADIPEHLRKVLEAIVEAIPDVDGVDECNEATGCRCADCAMFKERSK